MRFIAAHQDVRFELTECAVDAFDANKAIGFATITGSDRETEHPSASVSLRHLARRKNRGSR